MRGARVLAAAVSHKVRHYCSSAGRGRGRGRGTTVAPASSLPSPAVPPQPQPSAPGSAPASSSSPSVSKGRGRGDSPIIAAKNAAIGAQPTAAKATPAAIKANATSNAAKSATTTPATAPKANATSNAVKSTSTTPAATTNAAPKSPATTAASAGSKPASTTSASPTTAKAKKVAAAAATKTASVAVAGDSAAQPSPPATTAAQGSVASGQPIANVGAQATTAAQTAARVEASEAFAALIQSCAARGLIHEIDYVYGAMQAAQVSPTVQTCQTLLESYIQVGNVQKMDAMYAEMREARMGHQKPEASLQGKTQASEILTALINSWFSRGFLQEVDLAYRGIKACQLPVSMHTYRAMMEAYNLLGNYEAMDAVYKEMRASMTATAPSQPVTGAAPGYGAGHGAPLQPPTVYREQQQHIGQAHPSGYYPPPMQMQQAAYPPQQFQPAQQWPQPTQATYYTTPQTNPYMQQGVPPPAFAYHPQTQAYQPVYPGYQAGYQPGYPVGVQYQPQQPSYGPSTNVVVPPVRPPPQPAASVAPRPAPQQAPSVAPRPPPQPASSVAPRPPQRPKLELQPKALELLQKSEYNELLKGAADRASIMKPQIPVTVTSQVPMRPQSVPQAPIHHPPTAPQMQQPPIHPQVQPPVHPQVQRPTVPQVQPGVHPSMVSQYVPAGYAPPTFQPVPAGTGVQYAPSHYAPPTVHVTPLPASAPTGRPPFQVQSVPQAAPVAYTVQVAQGAAVRPTPTILQRPPIAPPQVQPQVTPVKPAAAPKAPQPQVTVKTPPEAPAPEKAQAKVSPQPVADVKFKDTQPKVTPQVADVKSPEVAGAKAKVTQISKPQFEVKDAAPSTTAKPAVESDRDQADEESQADIKQVDVKPASLKLGLKAKTDAKPKTPEVAVTEEPVVKPSLKLSSVGRGKAAAVAEDKIPDLPKAPSLRLGLKKQSESPKQVEQPGSPKEVAQPVKEVEESTQVEQSTFPEAESPRVESGSEAESEAEKPLPSLRKLIGRGRGKGVPTTDPVVTLLGLHSPSDAILQQDGLAEQDEDSANLPTLPFESRRGKGRGKFIDLNAAAEEEKRRKLKMEEAAARAIAILESGLGKSQMSAYLERRKKRVSEFSLGGFAGRSTETRVRRGKDPRQKAVQGEIDLDGAIEYIAPQEYMSRGDVLTEVEEAVKGTIHRHFMLDMDPEAAMEEFGTNPDIDDKPKPTLDETLDKAKEVLMAQDGIDEKEWEEAVTDVKKRAPQIKSLVERYTGPKKQSAKQNNKELHEIVSKLPPFASPELAASAKRVMMTLQDNPGWSHGDKRRLLTRLVKDVEKLGEAGAAS